MAITLLVVQGLLGLLFIITGSFKFFQNKEKVIASGGTWAEDFNPAVIKVIAGTELMSGILLLVSLVWPMRYVIITGAGTITIIMTGAIYTHLRRKEFPHAIINLIFVLMALFVCYAA